MNRINVKTGLYGWILLMLLSVVSCSQEGEPSSSGSKYMDKIAGEWTIHAPQNAAYNWTSSATLWADGTGTGEYNGYKYNFTWEADGKKITINSGQNGKKSYPYRADGKDLYVFLHERDYDNDDTDSAMWWERTSPYVEDEDDKGGDSSNSSTSSRLLLGKWHQVKYMDGVIDAYWDWNYELTFNLNGKGCRTTYYRYEFNEPPRVEDFKWQVKQNVLTLQFSTYSETYEFEVLGKKLCLYELDEDNNRKYGYEYESGPIVDWWLNDPSGPGQDNGGGNGNVEEPGNDEPEEDYSEPSEFPYDHNYIVASLSKMLRSKTTSYGESSSKWDAHYFLEFSNDGSGSYETIQKSTPHAKEKYSFSWTVTSTRLNFSFSDGRKEALYYRMPDENTIYLYRTAAEYNKDSDGKSKDKEIYKGPTTKPKY